MVLLEFFAADPAAQHRARHVQLFRAHREVDVHDDHRDAYQSGETVQYENQSREASDIRNGFRSHNGPSMPIIIMSPVAMVINDTDIDSS